MGCVWGNLKSDLKLEIWFHPKFPWKNPQLKWLGWLLHPHIAEKSHGKTASEVPFLDPQVTEILKAPTHSSTWRSAGLNAGHGGIILWKSKMNKNDGLKTLEYQTHPTFWVNKHQSINHIQLFSGLILIS